MTPPADSIPPLPPTNPNLGRGRFVERPAPALRPSRIQRRRVWIVRAWTIYVAWVLFFTLLLSWNWYSSAASFPPKRVLAIAVVTVPNALLYAVALTVPILLICFDSRWGSHAARVHHAKARRRLSRCCLHCRYPMPPSPHLGSRICTECGIESPNFLTFRRARLMDSRGWFANLPPADQPAISTAADLTKLLTLRERAECWVRGRALGLSWPLASLLFALLPCWFVSVVCCPASRFFVFDPLSIVFGIATFMMLTLMIQSNARTTFALNRFYSPPPTTPNTSSPE